MAPPERKVLLRKAENVNLSDEQLVKILFNKPKKEIDNTIDPPKIIYTRFLPSSDDRCLSMVHRAPEVTDDDLYSIGRNQINPGPRANKPTMLAVLRVGNIEEVNADLELDLEVERDNLDYDYHTSVGKYPEDEGEQQRIAYALRDKAIWMQIKEVAHVPVEQMGNGAEKIEDRPSDS